MSVLATAFWRRLDVPGSDAASLRQTAEGFELFGQAVFRDPSGAAALRYWLLLAPDWSTREGRITGFLGDRPVDDHFVRTARGWAHNGRECGMADILDLDLGFTPATNMAQLRRVALGLGETAEFDVAWFDAGAEGLRRLPQRYRRTDERAYAYESPEDGYHSTIILSPDGFAARYPGLWERVS